MSVAAFRPPWNPTAMHICHSEPAGEESGVGIVPLTKPARPRPFPPEAVRLRATGTGKDDAATQFSFHGSGRSRLGKLHSYSR